ncbi:MAG: type IX secretion system membrane protein PorP/SprF [Flavobacteriales bacterium]|nr:type IX secretion system membrane protein PorP/SprF [Flavobacteriales bacterium]MCB9449443.1 type IX secretion system membrane protein PorP/SprF [Flavobacteriales bacterium]
MMKKTILAVGMAFVGVAGYAQQDAQFSQNMFNRLAVNPGYAGSQGALCGTLLYRTQWVGFDGAPKTTLLSVDMPVKVIHGGVGLTVFSDELGAEKNFSAKLDYAYRKPIGIGTIGVGIELGLFSKSLRGLAENGVKNGLVPITKGDPSIPTQTEGDMTVDVGFGIYYHTSDNNLYFGVSTTHVPETDVKYTQQNQLIDLSLARHYYVIAGYNYQLPNPSLVLKPSVFIKSDAATTALDINTLLEWNSTIWAGASFRPGDAAVALVGFHPIQDLKIGYAYDFTLSEIKGYSSGSHEVMINYCKKITSEGPTQRYRNVRFL